MKILAKLGTLSDGRTALAIENHGFQDFVLARDYDESTGTWASGTYFSGSLKAFAEAVDAIEFDKSIQELNFDHREDRTRALSKVSEYAERAQAYCDYIRDQMPDIEDLDAVFGMLNDLQTGDTCLEDAVAVLDDAMDAYEERELG